MLSFATRPRHFGDPPRHCSPQKLLPETWGIVFSRKHELKVVENKVFKDLVTYFGSIQKLRNIFFVKYEKMINI